MGVVPILADKPPKELHELLTGFFRAAIGTYREALRRCLPEPSEN
jgi:hypothetical protein